MGTTKAGDTVARKSKTPNVKLSQAQKADLSKLRAAGVYKPKNPRKPTKYGKSLLSKFADILAGTSKAVKVERDVARNYRDKKAKPGTVRAVGNRVIVPVQKGEKAYYSKKRKELDVTYKLETGERYIRTPFKKVPRTYEQLESQLKDGDRIAVAYYRGKNNPVNWHYFDATEFYNTFVGGYADSASDKRRREALNWALKNSQISRYQAGAK